MEGSAPSEKELLTLLETGMAVKTDDAWVIRQVHVYSVPEFLTMVHKYCGYIPSGKSHVCLFRGQTRDYFDGNHLSIAPVAYRKAKWKKMYYSNKKELFEALSPWEYVLSNIFSLNLRSGAVFTFQEEGDDPRVIRRFAIDATPDGRISFNPTLMALLQHYGFPTPCLDVTSDPLIALWFSLHKADIRDGKIFYTPIADVFGNNQPDVNFKQPSVYVYLENLNNFVYDLTQIDNIQEVAGRPFVQHAFSLSFRKTLPTAYGSRGTPKMVEVWDSPTSRPPACVLKIHFPAEELSRLEPYLTMKHLFPKREPMYEKLVENNVPYVVRYE